MNAVALIPRCDVAIRAATMADLPFMDALQKKHSKQLGYFPTKQFEGYIENGHVLVAEEVASCQLLVASGEPRQNSRVLASSLSLATSNQQLATHSLGYVIAKDRYLKRDELGVVYQLCVAPQRQRSLVGAALVKAVFERAAYGCRLFCCWCAQDLAANYFWESLGFIPLAFRAGSGKKKRVHIFWQRRIDDDQSQIANRRSPRTRGGSTAIPYWYPFQTNSGAIREDRIVFPIPPGVHWSQVRAVELPVASGQLPVERKATARQSRSSLATGNSQLATSGKVGIIVGGRIKYVDRPRAGGARPAETTEKPARKKAEKPPKPKFDKKYLSAARELRDRYLEHVNDDRLALSAARGKYDVSRSLGIDERPMPLLAAG